MEEDINLRNEENTPNHMFMSSILSESRNNFHLSNASALVNSRRVVCIPSSNFNSSSLENVAQGSQASQGHSLHPTNSSAQVNRNQDQSVEAHQTRVRNGTDQSSESAPVCDVSDSSSNNSNGSFAYEVFPVYEKLE
ncbi:uncharacterized protein LOC109842729 isoform X2 [Asparagus officinalis]|uniref:uncharacterized protein LOC109842729 isoform X2 n=1 Tax=Asparagus officinalis TaxID=4686 RepID=UPI00098E5C3B|nr:uncharacterized protein LOC109842729 isoform X2 [Asparagus officinalis]